MQINMPIKKSFHLFLELPCEIQLHILKFLSSKDLWNVRIAIPPLFEDCFNAWWRHEFIKHCKLLRPIQPKNYAIAYLLFMNRWCFCCGRSGKTYKDEYYGFQICVECRKTHPFCKTITAKTCKSQFLLKNEDIATLQCVTPDGWKYGLYLKIDAEIAANKRYGNIHEETKKRENAKNQKAADRETELEDALAVMGLTIHPDSKLCEGYIQGTLRGWSLPKIVEECALMKYLHEYTTYPAVLKKAIKNSIDNYKHWKGGYDYKLSYDEEEPFVRQKYPKPDVWPWLKE